MPPKENIGLAGKRTNLVTALGGMFAEYLVDPKYDKSLITLLLEYKSVCEQLEEERIFGSKEAICPEVGCSFLEGHTYMPHPLSNSYLQKVAAGWNEAFPSNPVPYPESNIRS